MKKMTVLAIILALVLSLAACGSKEAPETTGAAETTVSVETEAPQPLELTHWSMSASTWSSPNGATIHISATPNYHAEGQKADFLVRLEGDDIVMVPCQWDESSASYTASADLNAANGYCYYILLTAADGTSTEVAVNTPSNPVNTAFIDMEAALMSYCSIAVEESTCASNELTLTTGKVQVQVPGISNEGETITCQEVSLTLTHDGQELGKQTLTLTETESDNLYEADLSGITFPVPELENEQKLELSLTATLSNGQQLSAYGGNWVYNTEELLLVVG